jgi:chromate transporter
VRFGHSPSVAALLAGVYPVVVVIVARAVLGLGRTAAAGPAAGRRWTALAVMAATFALALAGVNELVLLAAGALAVLAARRARGWPAGLAALALPGLAAGPAPAGVDLVRLAGVFLKVGALLFGSGYVLVAFLRADLVDRLGWLSAPQLLDAVSAGQVTPGPLFTTATFVGYVLAGVPGAAAATAAVFAPAFALVGLLGPLLPRLRASRVAGALLDGVNAAAVGLMAAVALQLGRVAITGPLGAALAAGAALALWRTRVNPSWLVLAGGAAGLAARLLG